MSMPSSARALILVLSGCLLIAPAALAADTEPRFRKALFQDMKWRNIGPYRGGRSTAVAGVPQDPLTYYFGSTGGGLWRTEDAGLNWQPIADGQIKTGSVGAVAVAPSDPNVIWVGMGESPVRGVMTTHGDGVYRSTDRGETWTHLGLEDSRHIARIRVHPDDPDVAWVAVQGHLYGPNEERGIYKTTDGGQSWQRVLFVDEQTGASDLSLDATNPRVLYAAMWQHRRYPWKVESGGPGSGIWKSVDGGENWKELTEGLPEVMGKIGVAASPADPRWIYAIVEAEDGGLFRSDDGGKTWKNVNDKRVLQARSWYYMHVHADPVDRGTVYVLNAPMMKSIDGGKTFTRVPTPHGDNHDLWIHPDDNQWMINANDGGANVSMNGGKSWTTQANQPTAQFYRVITDNRFPYHVYGGQQDNSAVAIQSRSMAGSIGRQHWHRISGCETAYPAFDPDSPRYIYAGCYQGIIGEYDLFTHTQRNVMAYPYLGLGAQPRDLKYRFNWNAPIVASPHDPRTIYHAGNVVLQSTDRGTSWQPISPDLTRNVDENLGPGGGPITNEAAGGETWHTILSLVESNHRQGELWVGTDDGLVHRSQDGGGSWQEVTPPRIGTAMVNSIDVSPHDADRVWLAVTGYKLDDLSPVVLVTENGGESWKRRVEGLPEDLIVRVVREDPKRQGLLFAGTETGVWVSFDSGAEWQALELDLPHVPVTDLTIQDDDLVISTQGRAFWILDGIHPLRQMNAEVAESDLFLFDPRGGYRTDGFQSEQPGHAGVNAPNGVILDYLVAESLLETEEDEDDANQGEENADDESPVLTLQILDPNDVVIHTVKADKPKDPQAAKLEPKAGHNRYVWNFRYDRVHWLAETQEFPSWDGHRVSPGNFRARLTLGEQSVEQPFQVWPDPRKDIQARFFIEQEDFLARIRDRIDRIHQTVEELRDARQQVKAWQGRIDGLDGEDAIRAAGKTLIKAINELEQKLVQPKQKTQQDIVNFPSQLNAEYLWLMALTDSSDPPLNRGNYQRLQDLDAIFDQRMADYQALVDGPLAEFNALFEQYQVPPVIVTVPETSRP